MSKAPARDHYATLTFDCYGTLIDWENGLLGFLQPLLESYDVHVIDDWVLELFAQYEPEAQTKGGSYRRVLGEVLQRFGTRLAFTPSEDTLDAFAGSIEYWQPYPDTVAALKRLKQHYRLAVVSNIDDDLFALTAPQLGVELDAVITAEQVGAYKPDHAMFREALRRVQGPVLHVAQSRFHDIAPARALGIDCAWINRSGASAARDVQAEPDFTFANLTELADALC
ncbi:MAG: HAD-IA family hydrolase [Pseudomonadales bacterium]